MTDLKNNQLYILFLASLNAQRDQVRQRKLLTQLENARTTRVKPEEVHVPDLAQINLAAFKGNDKR